MEELVTKYTILRITPESLAATYNINTTFAVIKDIQPIIVIFEDLDSFDFAKKNQKVGTFINGMDSITNAVFIATINDTTKVHNTIIDRPQRFDEVVEIKAPDNKEDIYTVMISSFNRITKKKIKDFPKIEEIDQSVFNRCLKRKFTQATIASIIDKIIILLEKEKDTGIENINRLFDIAVSVQEKSSSLLTTYKFGNKITSQSEEEICKEDISQ